MDNHKGFRDDRGAVLVHVAFALLALMAFASFTFDYGVFWVSRRQAQNAADAGALAGALALGLDDTTNFTDTGPAKQSALAAAQANMVWGQAPNIVVATDIQIFSGTGVCPPPNTSGTCIQVDVYRNQARGNALPMFFGSFVGLTQQGVRATATAQVMTANASMCLKPFAVADKWQENNPVVGAAWTPTATYDPTGPNPDVYTPQDGTSPGTGFTLANDYGVELTLKTGSPHDTINPGWFQPLDLTGGGGAQYEDNILGCAGVLWGIGDDIPKENGNMIGPTAHGIGDLIDLDPYATWNPVTKKIEGSCVGVTYTCAQAGYSGSPRIIAIPVFDLDYYLQTGGPGNGTVRVRNILGFFVKEVVANDVIGVLVTAPALSVSSNGGVAAPSSFATAFGLVR